MDIHLLDSLKYNHLERRNHTYYFRYWIPSWVRHFFKKENIRYSLNTNDYNVAIHLVKRETFKYDTLLNDVRWLIMEIRNGKLRLSQDDIENIIAQRIKEIQDKLDESYYKIKNGEISPNNIDITMLDEKGNRQFWINADKACVFLNEKIGKCFGFVKLENPMVEIFGTNLLWNTSSTNLFTVEKNVTLKIKQLDNDMLKGKK